MCLVFEQRVKCYHDVALVPPTVRREVGGSLGARREKKEEEEKKVCFPVHATTLERSL